VYRVNINIKDGFVILFVQAVSYDEGINLTLQHYSLEWSIVKISFPLGISRIGHIGRPLQINLCKMVKRLKFTYRIWL